MISQYVNKKSVGLVVGLVVLIALLSGNFWSLVGWGLLIGLVGVGVLAGFSFLSGNLQNDVENIRDTSVNLYETKKKGTTDYFNGKVTGVKNLFTFKKKQ